MIKGWYLSEPSDVPYSPNQFLSKDFFAVSYSKPALKNYLLQITLLTDRFATVRIAAFNCITECVKAVTNVPLSDANIFPEYILPNLVPLCNDRNDLVRAAFASR